VAKAKETRIADPAGVVGGVNAAAVERLINLLALLVIKGEPQAEKIGILARAGFSNTEIARLLGLTQNAVNVALYKIRKGK